MMLLTKTSPQTTVQAHQCGLWFCLQSYKVTVKNGTVNRSVISEWSKTDFTPKGSLFYDNYYFVDIPAEMNAKGDARYSVPSDAVKTLRAFMDKLTVGRASQVAGALTYDTDWIQAMEAAVTQDRDLSGWISKLAHSLTNDIQLTGLVRPEDGNLDYAGKAYIMAPHVEVDWYWVAYPVSLMMITFLYLIQTVWRTARNQVCAWKGDSLPVSDSCLEFVVSSLSFSGPGKHETVLSDVFFSDPVYSSCVPLEEIDSQP
jgi:hypothetical protein